MARAQEGDSKISKVLKYLLFAFNLFYWAVGGVMMGIGLWAVTQKSSYKEFSSIATDPAAVLIAVGSLIFIVSFFGTVGALRENMTFLNIYKWVMVVIVVLELIGGILAFAFWPEVRRSIDRQFKNAIEKYRDDPDLQNAIDAVQENFECCGSADLQDWQINRYFECGGPSIEACGVPYTCCVRDKDEKPNIQCGWNARKGHRLEVKDKIYLTGCLDAVVSWFKEHLMVVAAVAIAFLFPEILGIIMTHIFINQIRAHIEHGHRKMSNTYRNEPDSRA